MATARTVKVARVVTYWERTRRGWKRITEARYRKLKPPRKREKPWEPAGIKWESEKDPYG